MRSRSLSNADDDHARGGERNSLTDALPGLRARMLRPLLAGLSGFLGVPQVEQIIGAAASHAVVSDWASAILASLGVRLTLEGELLGDVIPSHGPVVVVANHPFGILDGLAAAALLLPLRNDLRYLGQSVGQRVPQASAHLFPLRPTGGLPFQRENARSLRQAIQWVQDDHVLALFPAATVSHWSWKHWRVEDPPWSTLVGTLVRSTAACVVPLYFHGHNSLLFQAVSATRSPLRHALLLREALNKRGSTLRVTVGRRLGVSNFPHGASAAEITAGVRHAVESLRN